MWDSYREDKPKQDIGRYIRYGLFGLIGVIIFGIVSNQSINILMNVNEFSQLFTKPIYYAMFSGVVLSAIALIRVDIRKRESMIWWIFALGISFIKRESFEPSQTRVKYHDFKLSKSNYAIWQVTKVLLLAPLFTNLLFGMAALHVLDGKDLGLESVGNIFYLPFITSPDPAIAKELVIPMVPALTLLIPPLLGAIGVRLMLYVGIRNLAHLASSYVVDSSEGKPKFLLYISVLELIIGAGLLWTSFNMFFTFNIDYNTKYALVGAALLGAAFIAWSIIDRAKSKVIILPSKRNMYIRLLTIASIAVIVGSIMAVNNSIADARKIEYLGPYTAQQIAVNRYIAELDQVKEEKYDVRLLSVDQSNIKNVLADNRDLLTKIRLWDWRAANEKLQPDIGLFPYIQYEDQDTIRFNGTLYWSAAMKPVLPSTVAVENRWYNEHLVYTHVPDGFKMLNAHSGEILGEAQTDSFFEQRRIYYGEGGLIKDVWSAFPVNREESVEVAGNFYDGNGGITVSPPVSWIFEPNFLLSYPNSAIHVLRYKDVHDRMSLLYPYFVYHFGDRNVDVLPVTDGKSTYWLMPMILRLDTTHVPWSASNQMFRLVGYALVDVYNGSVQVVIKGNDFFTNMFVDAYQEQVTRENPAWLRNQLRYPEELFYWKLSMFNIYHVTNVGTFIGGSNFFDIPTDIVPYYIFAKPPGFDKPEYLGLLSVELKGSLSQTRNLAGYMVVRNDYPHDGELKFYEVQTDSPIKLYGPTGAREALGKDPEYAQLRTLLSSQGTPRVGDNVIYRIGDHDVYFMPVYTAGTGGAVATVGTVAVVGAAVTGENPVGLGKTVDDAFREYLEKLAGVKTNGAPPLEIDRTKKIENLEKIFEDSKLRIDKPIDINVPLAFEEEQITYDLQADLEDIKKTINDFIDAWKGDANRVVEWDDGAKVNFGFVINNNGIIEVRYVSVEVGE